MTGETDGWTVLIIVCMAGITVLTRSMFYISSKPGQLPRGAQRGLQYAPIAALAGVILPELLMTQGQFITTWQDARIYAVAVGVAWYFWRRGTGQAVLGTILAGMAVYLPLHMGWGW
jgi:branched-subunit amino acid transport protein